MKARCSRHATRRIRQRGVKGTLLALLLQRGDREVDVGHGCIALSFSHEALGDLPPALGERARNLVAVLAGERLVTVLHAAGRSGRLYVRGAR